MKNKLTRHHEICQNWIMPNGQKIKGTNHKDNIILLWKTHHQAQHNLYKNYTFPGQLEELFKLNYTSLSNWVKSDIIDILNHDELRYFFKDHCYKK